MPNHGVNQFTSPNVSLERKKFLRAWRAFLYWKKRVGEEKAKVKVLVEFGYLI